MDESFAEIVERIAARKETAETAGPRTSGDCANLARERLHS